MTTHHAMQPNAGPGSAFPLSKPVIVLASLVFPLWGSSILYWAWREKHPEAARYALRMGWLVVGPLLLVAVLAGGFAATHKKNGGGEKASTSSARSGH